MTFFTVDLYREVALQLAARETSPDRGWSGPRQVIFIHLDGTLELWEKELIGI